MPILKKTNEKEEYAALGFTSNPSGGFPNQHLLSSRKLVNPIMYTVQHPIWVVPAGFLSSPNIQNSPLFFATMSNSPRLLCYTQPWPVVHSKTCTASMHTKAMCRARSRAGEHAQSSLVTALYRKKVMNNCAHKGEVQYWQMWCMHYYTVWTVKNVKKAQNVRNVFKHQ